jgi:ABC-type multidrug transport system ATPase subunit/pSer/pThr/pTyr-binding forkhead associated (FHA) protein
MDKTESFKANHTGRPYLAAFHYYGHIGDFELAGRMRFGRTGGRGQAQIEVPVPSVSGLHGEFGSAQGHWFYRDLGSSNGSRINGKALTSVHEMLDGDILTVVPRDDEQQEPAFAGIFVRLRDGEDLIWRKIRLVPGMQPIRIGRQESGLSPEDPTLSASHALFRYGSDGLSVLDEGSLNGVIVNGERCDARQLKPLDVVRLGRSLWIFTEDVLWAGEIREAATGVKKESAAVSEGAVPASGKAPAVSREAQAEQHQIYASAASAGKPAPAVRPAKKFDGSRLVIDIDERSVWKNFKKRVLLRDIHLAVEPGDMVLILGGSGAGKSTLIKSVMGYDKAEGTIRYGDKDVYKDYEDMKHEIGYVPQQDLVRPSDNVRDTLMAAARIRMPGDSTLQEQSARVDWLMEVLGLTAEKDNLIGSISGGQKKRVSIGIELAADPALFFLDEPDSGLDGPTASGLMEQLRTIADLGKIVMVITHSPDRAFHLFTKVIVLGKTEDQVGHLLFFGTPTQALSFFGTDRLETIVRRINSTSEGGEGLADHYYSQYEQWEAEHGGRQ